MGITSGFNPVEVSQSIGKIQTAYNGVITWMGDKVQAQFVNGMAPIWASDNAVKFFGEFKTVMDGLLKNVNTVFTDIVSAMDISANNWAMSTGDTTYHRQSLSAITKTIDVSEIKDNITGNKGMNKSEVSSVRATLESIKTYISNNLENAKNAVSTCGFLGGDQAANLQATLSTVKTNIETAFETYKEKVDDYINTEIDNALSAEITNATNLSTGN